MRNKPNYHRKGSVIVMVVGLLVMLAMIGTTFIIVAYMDRKESRSIATAAPMKQVAGGILQQIRVKLADDLHFDATTGAIIYGSAADYKQQADCPREDYDEHLASYGPVDVGGSLVWLHLSNLTGDLAEAGNRIGTDGKISIGTNAGTDIWDMADAGGNSYGWVDTDGDGVADAISYFSGATNRSGGKYYVAVRLIDASALMNANSADGPPAAAVAGTVMPITNISLEALTNAATRGNVHEARNGSTADPIATYNDNYVRRPLNPNPPGNTYLPFGMSDMLALAWGGAVPNTASGRLWEALELDGSGQFDKAKYLTAHSASRDYARRYSTDFLDMTHRIDLKDKNLADLFKAFYNAIPEGIAGFTPDINARRLVAAQLAVNAIDYQDSDNNVTVAELDAAGDIALDDEVAPVGTIIYGIERQPFITELFYKVYMASAVPPPGVYNRYSAIELFNPYKTGIRIIGFKLTEEGTEKTPTGGWPDVSISPGRRIVIVSDNATIPVHADAEMVLVIPGLDINKGVKIYRSRNSDGTGAKDIPLADATVNVADPGLGLSSMAVLQRDDVPSHAKYSLAVANTFTDRDYTNADGGGMTAGNTNLGRANDNYTCAAITAAKPTPVFVRNGNLINLGEVSRIFFVGPKSDGTPLDEVLKLSANNVSNGRLYTLGAIKPPADPVDPQQIQIPPACMLGDYMDALTPSTDNTGRTDTVYGRININTAPWQVIQYLPGISALTTEVGVEPVTSRPILMRERVARDIVAYRDLLDNSAAHIGGTDYSAGAGTRDVITGLTDLRADAGFASPGEVAIPLARVVTPHPNNTYSASAPDCYRVAGGSDDGLDDITGDLSKHDIYYSWLSNQITVRSDVYIAYIRVQVDSDSATTGPVRKYVAVIDRGNCTSSGDMPDVLMFAEMK